eukprot:1044533-Rhodomonas_salina.2
MERAVVVRSQHHQLDLDQACFPRLGMLFEVLAHDVPAVVPVVYRPVPPVRQHHLELLRGASHALLVVVPRVEIFGAGMFTADRLLERKVGQPQHLDPAVETERVAQHHARKLAGVR